MLPYVHLNGQLLPYEQAAIQLMDLGLLRGYGIFDFFLFRNGRPLFLEHYLDRFYRSAGFLNLQVPLERELMPHAIEELIQVNAVGEGGIRLLLTGGYAADSYTPLVPNFAILQHPAPPDTGNGRTSLMTYRHQRELPHIKSTNYLTGIAIQPRLRQAGAEYVLYHDGTHLRESDRSNFFLVDAEGTLVTPAERILPGITRGRILELARSRGLAVMEREVKLTELARAREAFLTSSTKGVLPVTHIDGRSVGTGETGPVARALQAAFAERARQEVQAARQV